MGTRGLFAFRYKGYYYIKYNQCDSYPEGLGRKLVSAIPKSQEEFEQWLDTQKKRFERSEDQEGFKKSKTPPENSLFIEWTYTYDLDNLAFVVDSQAFFSLQAIAQKFSDEWIPFLSLDAQGDRCLDLETPSELVAQLKAISYPFLGGHPMPSVDDFVPTSTIPPSTWSQSPLPPHHQRLMLSLVNLAITDMYGKLASFHWLDPTVSDTLYLFKSFLEAIVPNNQAVVANEQSPTHPNAVSPPESPYRDPVVWYHESSPLPPRDPWFWYRGCLIFLASDLDDNEHFQICVQAVAARAKAKNRDRCTALLWSIRHVAVVEISGATVSHSDPLPLVKAYGSDEDGFMNALRLLWYYLPDPRWRIVNERMRHRPSDFGGLPTEIVMRIMAFTDQLHYPKYQFLSHSFFILWREQLRFASWTILPDAELQVEPTSRYFNAYSPDADMPVKLRLMISWGKATGSLIWRDDSESDKLDELLNRSPTLRNLYIQRFYSYWPEDLTTPSQYDLPRVVDRFHKERVYFLRCKLEPL